MDDDAVPDLEDPGRALAEAALPPAARQLLREHDEVRRAALAAAAALDGEASLGAEILEAGRAATAQAQRERRAEEARAAQDFAKGTALKRGFLLGGGGGGGGGSASRHAASAATASSSPVSATPPADAPVLRPTGGSMAPGLLPEVQEAMRAQGGAPAMQAKLQGERAKWLTPELLERVAREPRLAAGMQNPSFMQALAELGADPRAALERYKRDEGVQDFLRTFMGLMGSHFEKVAEGEDEQRRSGGAGGAATSAQGVAAIAPPGLTPVASRSLRSAGAGAAGGGGGDGFGSGAGGGLLDQTLSSEAIAQQARAGQLGGADAEARRILSDRDLVDVLRDPVIQKILEECRADGSRIVRYMAMPDVRKKLLIMQLAGLIRLEGI